MSRPLLFTVRLTGVDREVLSRVVSSGTHPVRLVRRARTLLELDENAGPVAKRAVVADRVGLSEESVRQIAKQFVATGGSMAATITPKVRETPPVESKLTGDVEARLIALACSTPPAGQARWSLRLLEKQVALMPDLPALDHSTIGRL